MTENPAPDTTPEGRGPERKGTEQAGHTTPQQAGAENTSHQPTAPLPAFRPAADGAAQGSNEHTGNTGADTSNATQPLRPATWEGQQGHNSSPDEQSSAAHPGHQSQQGPSYPHHQPFYGVQSQSPQHGGPQPTNPYNGPTPYGGAAHYTGPAQYSQQGSTPGPHPASAPHQGLDTTPRRKPAFGVGTLVASILAAGLVGGGVVAGSNAIFGSRTPAAVTSSQPGTVIVNNKDDVNVITAAAAKASPSVVTIKASSGGSGGTGSGIILDGEGHILTNTHVVTLDGTTANPTLEVRTNDGKVLKATVVGTDPLSDLAVIKVENAGALVPATLGDSSKINVGDTAVAIGSPLGLTGTVTDGIVSTLNRTITVASSAAPKDGSDNSQGGDQGFQFAPPDGSQSQRSANEGSISLNVIQTDAAINPGNSGGALVNNKGEIIGVNVAIASAGSSSDSSAGNIGVGFSVPINHAKRVAQEIIKNGKASHGQFGVSVKPKSASGSSSGFSVGAQVASVVQGSAAAKAGIQVGDVITKFGERGISDPNQLTAAVREQSAGATVKVTIQRNGQDREIDVTLDAATQ